MAILTRKYKKIFASSAPINVDTGNVVFGSNDAGLPVSSNDPVVLEGLPAFEQGFDEATISGTKLPVVGEIQGLKNDTDYHLAYIYQEGLQVYDSQTTYSSTSIVREPATANLWRSLVSPNVGNALVEGANWTFLINLATSQNPVGSIVGWDNPASPPTNYIALDGSVVLISDIPLLAPIIYCGNVNNGTADYYYKCTNPADPNGSRSTSGTYILLKDTSGRFARGWRSGQTIDSGRVFDSYQDDAFQGHLHPQNHPNNGFTAPAVSTPGGNIIAGIYMGSGNISAIGPQVLTDAPFTDGPNGTPRTAAETRPINYTEIKIIKYQ